MNSEKFKGSVDALEQDLRQVLEARGQRCTVQREAVYRFLYGTDIHPTAKEILSRVRDELPGISLATVYKNLETLVRCGLVQKLSYRDTSTRYDGRTEPHLHARCLTCEGITDIFGNIPSVETVLPESQNRNFRVTDFRMELTGYCAQCDRGEAAQA